MIHPEPWGTLKLGEMRDAAKETPVPETEPSFGLPGEGGTPNALKMTCFRHIRSARWLCTCTKHHESALDANDSALDRSAHSFIFMRPAVFVVIEFEVLKSHLLFSIAREQVERG